VWSDLNDVLAVTITFAVRALVVVAVAAVAAVGSAPTLDVRRKVGAPTTTQRLRQEATHIGRSTSTISKVHDASRAACGSTGPQARPAGPRRSRVVVIVAKGVGTAPFSLRVACAQ